MRAWSVICHRVSQIFGVLLAGGWLWVLVSAQPWYPLSRAILPIYALAGLFTGVVYAVDKRAATQEGAWRTPERMLHQLNFAGGLVGGALGQWWLRHKNRKPEFLKFFYAATACHVALWALVAWIKL